MILGLLTDIFDGIIARKLNISTVTLRKLDSIVDRFFWLMILVSCYLLYPEYIRSIVPSVGIILAFEALVFGISFIRFGKAPSPHNLISKAWGISVAVAFAVIILTGSSYYAFFTMFALAILSRTDSMLIYLLLRRWDHDIPSFYHAILIRNGKIITRNDLFNG
jgi:CDP-diacylglycerol--glycerol-3-phosphate 3-phosphatidyltransferase